MYLSQITLAPKPNGRGSLAALLSEQAGAYDGHRLVWSLFSRTGREERDFLYRMDRRDHGLRLHTLSPEPPADETGLFDIQSKPVSLDHTQGKELRFLLRANAVVRSEGKAHDIVLRRVKRERAAGNPAPDTHALAEEEGAAWLARQGAGSGFTLQEAGLLSYGQNVFHKKRDGRVKIAHVELQGRLRVDDPACFRAAVARGFGRAKAFGYGLMLLRPPG